MTTGASLPDMPTFGRYQPLFRIASGGMAEVYGARAVGEAGFTRWVALKRILPHLSDDTRFVEMFLDEARLAANIQSQHVVPTLDLGRASDGSLYLVMELVVGVTFGNILLNAMRIEKPLDVPLAVGIVAQAAQGLHDAHEARSPAGEPLNIVHRDVSPRNILVGVDGRARILDFGIAQGELRAAHTAIGEVKGTQAYFSPEQATLQKLDRRSDVYALGIVLWEALTGQRLFNGNALIEVRTDVPRVDSVRPDVPPELAAVVEGALQRDRERRYQTAEALALALRATMDPGWADTTTSEIAKIVRRYGGKTLDRIQAGMQRSTPERVVPLTDPAPPMQATGRLRAYGTSFIGREKDLASLEEILTRGDRLVTLFGPGGMGKTRLAIELAQRVRDRFPGGVLFCDFADVRTAEGLCQVAFTALGAPPVQGTELRAAVHTLGRALAARGAILVVLDNVEQAMAHVSATLGSWLIDAPDTTFVATSRERLRLATETLYELAPLDVTGTGISPASRLFIDRATKVRRDLEIDATAERAIASIVKRLDGLPLAIELAASRVRGSDPVQLAEQLSERLRAPSHAARDASPRQATLDATIRWSWDLLDPAEQALFAGVSVFHGSFDVHAAAAVIGGGAEAEPIGQGLEQLVDKSLVRFVGGTKARFSMLASIREFASRELAARGAASVTMERYTRYYGELAAAWDDPVRAAWPSEVERDLDNLVHAFRWTLEHDVLDDAKVRRLLLLALAAEPVLGLRGPVSLARELLEQAVAACDGRDSDADLDARARLALARALLTSGDQEAAGAALAEARIVASFSPEPRSQAWVALTEAEQHWARGNLPRAIVLSAHAVEAGEEAGDLVLLSRAHFRWGAALHLRGDHEGAKAALERARSITRTLRYEQLEARVDVKLAEVAADMRDVTMAARIATSASALAARVGDRSLEANALATLGSLALERGDAPEALDLFTRAMHLAREAGHLCAEGSFLCFMGVAEEAAGRVTEARATLEAATLSSQRTGNRLAEGLSQTYLGRLIARAGMLEHAEQALANGASILLETGDRVRMVVARLCTGHLELAKADLAQISGDDDAAAAHRARARQLATSTRQDIDSGRLRSIEAQHALRVLQSDLQTHT